ncbi:hypothetical protein [Mariniflexile rhizosphaerae]|uniref:hypothetical protein n=1 Tax=unclassified Mariniflexile TaxID=2643887 RepID=UPI000E3C1E6E|nr:hypothetical protein [Mariniflexile sp. TRM1-10]
MKLILKFTEENNNFSHGVEFGRIFHKLENGYKKIDNNGFPIRIENKELIKNACLKYDYTPLFGEIYYEEWIEFMAIKNVSLSN